MDQISEEPFKLARNRGTIFCKHGPNWGRTYLMASIDYWTDVESVASDVCGGTRASGIPAVFCSVFLFLLLQRQKRWSSGYRRILLRFLRPDLIRVDRSPEHPSLSPSVEQSGSSLPLVSCTWKHWCEARFRNRKKTIQKNVLKLWRQGFFSKKINKEAKEHLCAHNDLLYFLLFRPV
jgi:hypothetical protein